MDVIASECTFEIISLPPVYTTMDASEPLHCPKLPFGWQTSSCCALFSSLASALGLLTVVPQQALAGLALLWRRNLRSITYEAPQAMLSQHAGTMQVSPTLIRWMRRLSTRACAKRSERNGLIGQQTLQWGSALVHHDSVGWNKNPQFASFSRICEAPLLTIGG